MSDLVQKDPELKQVRLAAFNESSLGKHEVMKISLVSVISKPQKYYKV